MNLAKKHSKYSDLMTLPENVIDEIIAGELTVSPRPGLKHARASSILGGEIVGPFDQGKGGPGGWWILDEPELHLGGDVLVPDLSGWKKTKISHLPTEQNYFDIAPDWVCEVLSKTTARYGRVKKLPLYAREKVSHVWLVDPETKTLEIYQLEGNRWLLCNTFAGDEQVRAAPFEAIEMDLGAL